MGVACTEGNAGSGDTGPDGSDDDPGSSSTASPTTAADDAPPLDDSTGGGDASTGSGPATGTDTTGTTTDVVDDSASSSDGGPTGCASDDDCTEADAPFCVSSACVSCSEVADSDAACAAKSADATLCVDGACVQCTADVTSACTGTTPVCDTAANTCVGCRFHADCPDSACHIPATIPARATPEDGACFDPQSVVMVDPPSGLQPAIDAIPPGGEGVIVLQGGHYTADVTVDGGRVIAMLAAPGQSPTWEGVSTNEPQFTVAGAATTVFMEGVSISYVSGYYSVAVQVDAGRLHLQRSAIVNCPGGGVVAQNDALLHAENSYLGGSGETAVEVVGADATILYSTILAGGGLSQSLLCTSPGLVDVRNSLLLTQTTSNTISCNGAAFVNNLTDQDLGVNNATVNNFSVAWFDDYVGGDFGLTYSGPGNGNPCQVGVWETGDPLDDIHGDLRPQVNNAADCVGADVP